ncbi:DUF6783 domain-containing protein [Robinsoniella sp. KNHs210]|uniref:DUF6783 domain-containing protein n=1 Tax=Robinsoniella sp. KNHs210 TaxID=1469950 RepID=UPI003FA758DB
MRNPRRHIWLYRPEQQHVTQILYCRKVCARACSSTNCDAHLSESNFKTRSRACSPTNWIILCNGK